MKTFILKCLIILALVFGASAGLDLWKDSAKPLVSNKLAVNQVNGGDADWIAMRTFERSHNVLSLVVWLLVIIIVSALIAPDVKRLLTEDGSTRNE